MATGTMTERTAIAAFEIDGRPVARGQVVSLTATQLERAVTAGVVHRSDTLNEEVPRQELPPTLPVAATERGVVDDLEAHTVEELKEIARNESATIPDKAKKGDLVAAIRAKRAAAPPVAVVPMAPATAAPALGTSAAPAVPASPAVPAKPVAPRAS